MKVGLYASMFGKDVANAFPDIESYIDYAYELRLDVIDLRSDVGFPEHGHQYLLETKIRCLEKGLSVGYLASGGHFVGSDDELEDAAGAGAEGGAADDGSLAPLPVPKGGFAISDNSMSKTLKLKKRLVQFRKQGFRLPIRCVLVHHSPRSRHRVAPVF